VVVGGGPAGLGAAVYGASEGLRTLLVERAGDRRAGRAEQPHRELPRVPEGPLGGGARAAGQGPGHPVRGRDPHHRRGHRHRAPGRRQGRPLRRRRRGDGARRRPGHRGQLHRPDGPGRPRLRRSRRLLRRGGAPGAQLRRAGRATSSAPPTAPAGGAVLRPPRAPGHPALPGDDVRKSMSEYLVARILATPEIEVRTCTEVAGGSGRPPRAARAARQQQRPHGDGRRLVALRVHRRRAPHRLARRGVRPGRPGFVLTGPDLLDADGRPPPAGRWPATRTCSSRACRACSWPATCGPRR
jgi:thioredoxin reductase (NADPH)